MNTIQLDKSSINPKKLSMSALKNEINQQKRSNTVLRYFMNVLESKRMKNKLGWSRPWNKYGINNFRSHYLFKDEDRGYLQNTITHIFDILPDPGQPYQKFMENLFKDPKLMCFTFYHNNTYKEQYEGLTISFGRIVTEDTSKRDRLDIIFEDKREKDGGVDGKIDQMRLYINPFEKFKEDEMGYRKFSKNDTAAMEKGQQLFNDALKKYNLWKNESRRQWQHWSIKYIDYFGPRKFIPLESSFL